MDISSHRSNTSATSSHASSYASEEDDQSSVRAKLPVTGKNDDDDSSVEEQQGRQGRGHSRRVKKALVRNEEIDGSGLPKKIDEDRLRKYPNCDSKLSLGVGMTEEQFRAYAKQIGMSDDLCECLLKGVTKAVEDVCKGYACDEEQISKAKELVENQKKLPVNASAGRVFSTVTMVGWIGYLTSFFLGKLSHSLATIPTDCVHGGWVFPLVAGALNATLSEPLTLGYRSGGASFPSPDGRAFADYHTAKLWMQQTKNDKAECEKWRKEMADIVKSVLARELNRVPEQYRSGIKEVIFDDEHYPESARTGSGNAIDARAAMDQVMSAARNRAYLTDELPFFSFTFFYLISGYCAPGLKAAFKPEPWKFLGADLGLNFACGSAAGISTAHLQAISRASIQGASAVELTGYSKRAKQDLINVEIAIINRKLVELRGIAACLEQQQIYLLKRGAEGYDVTKQIEDIKSLQLESKKAHKSMTEQYKKAKERRKKHQSSEAQRTLAIENSLAAARKGASNGEKKYQEEAMNLRWWSKVIAYPITLIPVVAYTAYALPAIFDSLAKPETQGALLNSTLSPNLPNSTNPTNSVEYDPFNSSVQSGLSALFGIPLILPWTVRNQFISRWIETGLVKVFGSVPKPPQDDDDSIVEISSESAGQASSSQDEDERVEKDDQESAGDAVQQQDDDHSVPETESVIIEFSDEENKVKRAGRAKNKRRQLQEDEGSVIV